MRFLIVLLKPKFTTQVKKSDNLSKACKGAHKTFAGYKWIYI